jgi:hypothetical protein
MKAIKYPIITLLSIFFVISFSDNSYPWHDEIARIANLSLKKGYQIEDEKRLLTRDEAYEQISYSASLFKAILEYVEKV